MAENSDEPSNPDVADLEAAPLSTTERFVCGLIGLGSFLTGAVAVFVADGEIGTGVLLAVGAFFLLMATTGRPITSAKIGDNEIQLARRVIRGVEGRLDTAPPEVRAELAEAVLEAAPAPWRPVAQKAQWVLFEEELAAELERLVPDADVERERSVGDHSLDLLIRQSDLVVGVEVKLAARRLNTDTVRRIVERAVAHGIDKLMIVSSSGFTTGARADQSGPSTPVHVELVPWSGPVDNSQLAGTLQKLGLRSPA
jgi:hypothetical protein